MTADEGTARKPINELSNEFHNGHAAREPTKMMGRGMNQEDDGMNAIIRDEVMMSNQESNKGPPGGMKPGTQNPPNQSANVNQREWTNNQPMTGFTRWIQHEETQFNVHGE